MKRKTLLTLLILTISTTLLSGCKTSDSEVKNETVSTESTETSETASTEPTGQDSLIDEVTDNIVYPDVNPEDVDPKTTTMDAETATALAQQEGKEIDAQYGSEEAWTGYAQSQGADGTLGWCWIYYTGQGAGDQESYAVYMKEDSPRYGEVFHLGDYLPGGDFFVGANNKEHGIADVRVGQRQVENGELDGVTFDEDGTVHIVIE